MSEKTIDPDLLEACRTHIQSKGVTLWRDWIVTDERGLTAASTWLARTITDIAEQMEPKS